MTIHKHLPFYTKIPFVFNGVLIRIYQPRRKTPFQKVKRKMRFFYFFLGC